MKCKNKNAKFKKKPQKSIKMTLKCIFVVLHVWNQYHVYLFYFNYWASDNLMAFCCFGIWTHFWLWGRGANRGSHCAASWNILNSLCHFWGDTSRHYERLLRADEFVYVYLMKWPRSGIRHVWQAATIDVTSNYRVLLAPSRHVVCTFYIKFYSGIN